MCFIMKTCNFTWDRIKTKKNISSIKIQSITMVKTIYWLQHTKKNRSRKKWKQRSKINKLQKQINEQGYMQKDNGKLDK